MDGRLECRSREDARVYSVLVPGESLYAVIAQMVERRVEAS